MKVYKVNYSYFNRSGFHVRGWEIIYASSRDEAEKKFLCNYPAKAKATASATLYTWV